MSSAEIKKIKETSHAAAKTITHLFHASAPTYPCSFPSMAAAQAFINAHCATLNFDYHLPEQYGLKLEDTDPVVANVKDKAARLVAVWAVQGGKFRISHGGGESTSKGVGEAEGRRALRCAVEAEIARILPTMTVWPASFNTVYEATRFVRTEYEKRGQAIKPFKDIPEQTFRGYVLWNTVRRAWEASTFEMDVLPTGWARAAAVKKPASLAEAIEMDIARLKKLIHTWPTTFPHLNEARNFVQDWCYQHYFRYTGWHDVDLRKFRLFVHFNTAKYALQEGVIKVERAVPKRVACVVKDEKDVRKEARDKGVEFCKSKRSASGAEEEKKHQDIVARIKDLVGTSDGSRSPGVTQDSDATASVPSETESSDEDLLIDTDEDILVQATAELQLEELEAGPVDPFKDLVAELHRGYVLKAAFE